MVRLRSLRLARGMTQRELADSLRTYCSGSDICQLEQQRLWTFSLERLNRVLGDIASFMGYDGEPMDLLDNIDSHGTVFGMSGKEFVSKVKRKRKRKR